MSSWSKSPERPEDADCVDKDSWSWSDDDMPSAPGKLEDASARSDSSPSPLPPPHKLERGEEERSLQQRMRALFPKKLSSIFDKWTKNDEDDHNTNVDYNDDYPTAIKILPNGTRVSPPVTPFLERRWEPGDSLRSSKGSQKPLITPGPPDINRAYDAFDGSELTSLHPAEYYAEKLEVYQMKYSYLKSWPGLLRLLAGLELLFGGMVFACIIAYIQKDSEWSNYYVPTYLNSFTGSGYSYSGPMTPFVLAVTGVAWIVTIILLVLGMTMYYRTILLDSPWWPVTEGLINVALFLLYMAAGIVYINDLNRGGMCYMIVGVNPIMSSLCRVDGGQMAGTAFIFINMLMYLLSFMVCLKMWRHEATRRAREALGSMKQVPPSVNTAKSKSKRIVFQDEMDQPERNTKQLLISQRAEGAETLCGAIPSGYVPKPRVIPDYIIKYPEITTVEDREQYKAVFNDQYQEYRELHKDISATLAKFRELDAMMNKLLRNVNTTEDRKRIDQMLKKYELKKNDPSFLEKKDRCEYLKAKLSHIKNRIRNFDEKMSDNSQT
ncbi:hypothetical protein AALO_G00002460 [Alosa alosa]|uniref:MARVEL domain-containing protein 2-like n=1 Tax=Alosa alosa TaxID=278164 RepID=A0AAV6HFU8_9TELE|nr:hypothetical protein AALO_G00002460 [Alosa alosa]